MNTTLWKQVFAAAMLLTAALGFSSGTPEGMSADSPREAGGSEQNRSESPGQDGPTATAIFAGGCFWGVEYFLERLDGVSGVVSGYTGGTTDNPSYYDVLSHTTGHVEAVQVTYNPELISYEELTAYFFEIHDPTQTDGQGPDIGEQYLSMIFYGNDQERAIAEKLIGILEREGYDIATALEPAAVFWPAEKYHQDYYTKKGMLPYCHGYTKRFP